MELRNKTPLVSVLIPTFNDDLFLGASLECVLGQTLKNIEIICIDDGSTDSTQGIIKQLQLKDKRIKLIIKTVNQGVSVARNEAMKLATGKYFTFVDGDDLMDETLLEKAYILAENTNSDMVIWDYLTFSNTSEILKNKNKDSILEFISPNDKISLLKRPAFSWVKMIKTKVAYDLEISFPEGLIREDIPVHWHLITSLDKIAVLPLKLSYYRLNPASLTHKKKKILLYIGIIKDNVKDYLIEANLYETYKNEFLRQQLNLLHGMYDSIKPEYKDEALALVKERLTAEHYDYINDVDTIRKPTKYFFLGLKGDIISKLKLNLWLTIRSLYRSVKK